jgi:transcriptional regulator with XRE-family HTH domain
MIERGSRAPSYDTIQALAQALDVPIAELFRDAEEMPQYNVHHQKLVDFARRARLSRKQVEQLVAVGRALFEAR